MEDKKYLAIVAHYEACLDQHGDSHLGVDWPKQNDAETRYRVMLEIIKEPTPRPIRLLDFGCGASHLYEFIVANSVTGVEYSGLDISPKFIALSREKFPFLEYYCCDFLNDQIDLPIFDYIVMNGVFTERQELTFDEMFDYFKLLVKRAFDHAARGIAFNVMSSHVDWERDDLFHLPIDSLAAFLTKSLSRNFTIRNDYGLYEYTTYVYKAG
jgi:SAM-dependent methyltransferase